MRITHECKEEIAMVERITGRRVATTEPIVMYQAELATLTDTDQTETVYYGTFENQSRDTAITSLLTLEDDGGTHMQTCSIISDADGITVVASNRAWTHLSAVGVDGKTMFYGWKMTLAPHTFGGTNIVIDGDFPDPNVQWNESGGVGATFVYGQPGATYDDNSTGTPGSLSHFLAEEITSPTGKFLVEYEIANISGGSMRINLNGAVQTDPQTSDGVYSQILNVGAPLSSITVYFSVYVGTIVSLSVKPMLS